MRTFFQNLKCQVLGESAAIERTPLPYKTTFSKTNIKVNGIGNTKRTYHKERSFATNYFFPEIFFEYMNVI